MQDVRLERTDLANQDFRQTMAKSTWDMTDEEHGTWTADQIRGARDIDARLRACDDEDRIAGTIFVRKPRGKMLQNPKQ